MSKALFISASELKRKSIIDGNVDADKLLQFIEVAQDTQIHNYLGTDLYDKLQLLITGGTIDGVGNAAYKTLLVDYIKPMLVWYAQSTLLPFLMYQASNGGVYKHSADNAESITLEEMSDLLTRIDSKADSYTKRFIDYICNNESLFPEYTSNSDGDKRPDKDINYYGWVL